MRKDRKGRKHRECVVMVFKRTGKGKSQTLWHKEYISYDSYTQRQEIVEGIKERFTEKSVPMWRFLRYEREV